MQVVISYNLLEYMLYMNSTDEKVNLFTQFLVEVKY